MVFTMYHRDLFTNCVERMLQIKNWMAFQLALVAKQSFVGLQDCISSGIYEFFNKKELELLSKKCFVKEKNESNKDKMRVHHK